MSRGSAFVELVFVLPLLLLIVAGTVELGLTFMEYNTLRKSLRDAARYIQDQCMYPAAPPSACYNDASSTLAIPASLLQEATNLVRNGVPTGGSPLMTGFDTVTVTNPTFMSLIATDGGWQDHFTISASFTHTVHFFWYTGNGLPVSIPMTVSETMRLL
ncbi:hypothetical protein MoryE10_05760 [Methylogaea oryzae]|uniref:TadE-like domain-containing protein n=1 Tax=Methylogaea oryzae TaxID=1295382 RepID=A0A8D4VP82_9GAMM|nr:hypothetical protein MoryE10_05760 [Methylogaea oryzae]